MYEGAAIELVCFFKNLLTAAAVNARISLCSKLHWHQKEGTVASYYEAMNYLLKTYTVNDLIVESEADMMPFAQSSNRSLTEFSEALCNKTVGCHRVYHE